MELFVTLTSPYARLARAVIIEKGLQDRVKITPIQTRTPDSPLYAINPSGRVPTLVTDDGTVFEESAVICAFLDHLDGARIFEITHDDNRLIRSINLNRPLVKVGKCFSRHDPIGLRCQSASQA